VVSNNHGLTTFLLEDPIRLCRIAFYKLEGAGGLLRPVLPIAHNTTYLQRVDGGGLVLYLPTSNEPYEIVHYENDPWFKETVQSDRMLAQIGKENSKYIILYEVSNVFDTFVDSKNIQQRAKQNIGGK
jgi:hypothetical protein